MRYRLLLAYAGGNYKGWQIQPGQPTIQGVVETALFGVFGRKIRVIGAGRTDAGVHATGQTAHLDLDKCDLDLRGALNARLPRDVRILEAKPCGQSFHARKSALFKTYIYRLWQEPLFFPPEMADHAWQCGRLDLGAMMQAIPHLLGAHDFASFQNIGTPQNSTVRRIYGLDIEEEPQQPHYPLHLPPVRIAICANGFLKQMARNITGMLVALGKGKLDEASLAGIMAAKNRAAMPAATAPAAGLSLAHVGYAPEDSFFLLPG